MEKVTVSIVCDVFNHEPYLRQCLDGFVMQKTDFPFEILNIYACKTSQLELISYINN